MENVGLDDAAKKDRILIATRRYGDLPEVRNTLMRFRTMVTGCDTPYLNKGELQSDLDADARETAFVRSNPITPAPERVSRSKAHRHDSVRSFSPDLVWHYPRFFKQPAKHYWDHLTLDSLRNYEATYDRICNFWDGLVSCKTHIKINERASD